MKLWTFLWTFFSNFPDGLTRFAPGWDRELSIEGIIKILASHEKI
jgi:hypothetical protein